MRYDAVIIVPPFFQLTYPSLGAHVLQACARASGFRVRVLYSNLLLASHIGLKRYALFAQAPLGTFAGERLFARTAYGIRPLGNQAQMFTVERVQGHALAQSVFRDEKEYGTFCRAEMLQTESRIPAWIEALGRFIGGMGIRVIGATTTFQQTAPAIALLKAARSYAPDAVTIIGGANCEGEMAEGIATIAPFVDHIFSGESEATFPEFLRRVARGDRPIERIIYGTPCEAMDSIPPLDYDEYFAQRTSFLGASDNAAIGPSSLPYETSRGCWWGQKQHCTFCGLNGEGMGFRAKTPDLVIQELRTLNARYRPASIIMADNIMPYDYFGTLLPRLARELPGLNIFYEQKANIARERLVTLKKAGIHWIQPGIEALSTELLQLMRKGTTARQNVSVLRDALGVGIVMSWNLLWAFPGDRRAAYEETLALLPLLCHLEPPTGFIAVGIDRFSPYFDRADQFDVSNLRPCPGYYDFLPSEAAVEKVAYHFTGDYACAAAEAPDLMRELSDSILSWQKAWAAAAPPQLRLSIYGGAYVLTDTRGLRGTKRRQVLSSVQAGRLLESRPLVGDEEQNSAIDLKLAVRLDGYFVPLVVAEQSVFERVREAAGVAADRDDNAPLRRHTARTLPMRIQPAGHPMCT
jgi:ribosomal peptide maturation radical SAM protein 1